MSADMKHTCPLCGSDKIAALPPKDAFLHDGHDTKCLSCGAIWRDLNIHEPGWASRLIDKPIQEKQPC